MNRMGLTIKEKINLLDDAKNGVKKSLLAEKYNCNLSTVFRVIRGEQKIRELGKFLNLNKKRNRTSAHAKIEHALNSWYKQQLEQNINVTREKVLNAAIEISNGMDSSFVPTPTWIWRWGKRLNVKFSRKRSNVNNSDKDVESEHFDGVMQCIKEEASVESNGFNISVLSECPTTSHESFEHVMLEQSDGYEPCCDNQEVFNKSASTSAGKHSWLSQLVLTQIESIHPDDRGDFAWEVHKLIRKYQIKNKLRATNT
ncbi:uncharacterized protein LOC106087933 [Stomoxys calcitrans]|uniref:uncharacterized protein LOC106087933 n=1 Tax=Stomoxys calcitrans TaxID=35570 RepID=UPI0027E3651D|nr:uncharacterized protein LOC106087933 [Stomoxys calcitrans]